MPPEWPYDQVRQPASEAVTTLPPPLGRRRAAWTHLARCLVSCAAVAVVVATLAGEELMTRREVAYRFGVTTATVKNWARSKKVALTEVHDDQGKPRYRRTEVDALFESGFRGFESRSAASRLRRM
jgi:DNA-directed RNA polymerase specialized sigma24 family protein